MTLPPTAPDPNALVKALQLVQVANRYSFIRKEQLRKLVLKASAS